MRSTIRESSLAGGPSSTETSALSEQAGHRFKRSDGHEPQSEENP
jgi:hypothetical protein